MSLIPGNIRQSFILVSLCAAAQACSSAGSQATLSGSGAENTANLTASGTWTLSPLGNTSRCLMPLGGNSDNGTPIVLGDCDGSAAQAWTRTGEDSGMSLMIFDNKCIDVVDGKNTNGTKLQLWDCFSNNDNQKWAFANGALTWNTFGKCLDLTDGLGMSNTNPMQVWDCFGDNDNQKWKFVAVVTAASPNQTTTPPASDSNTVAASPNTQAPPAPVVYSPVDLSTLTTASRRGIQSITNQATPTLCMGLAGFPSNPGLVSGSCDGSGPQQFAFDGNGRIGYPSQQTTINNVTYAKGAYCLSVGMAGRLNAGLPVFVPCNSGDNNQIWGQAGNVMVSISGKTCLGSDPNAQNPNAITLGACTTRPGQAWVPQM